MKKSREVTLTNGEKIQIHLLLGSDSKDMSFTKTKDNLVVAIIIPVVSRDVTMIFILKEKNGVYKYIGDIGFSENNDNTVSFKIVTCLTKIEDQAKKALSKQIEQYNEFPGLNCNCVDLLASTI